MRRWTVPFTLGAFALLLICTTSASAQTSPDFLFGKPRGTVGVRSGWMFASANSDLFTDIQDQFTVERKDFNAPAVGIDMDFALTPRASIVAGFDFSKSSKNSEYRDFVDNDRLPIMQTTSLREMNFSGSVKFALTPRGREVSSRAWIPAAITPYVGAGGGILQYRVSAVRRLHQVRRFLRQSPTRSAPKDGRRARMCSAASM